MRKESKKKKTVSEKVKYSGGDKKKAIRLRDEEIQIYSERGKN